MTGAVTQQRYQSWYHHIPQPLPRVPDVPYSSHTFPAPVPTNLDPSPTFQNVPISGPTSRFPSLDLGAVSLLLLCDDESVFLLQASSEQSVMGVEIAEEQGR